MFLSLSRVKLCSMADAAGLRLVDLWFPRIVRHDG